MTSFVDTMDLMCKSYNQTDKEKQDEIKRIEDSIKAKPTLQDLNETVNLLNDFGIHITIEDIPDCYNVAAFAALENKYNKQKEMVIK